MEKQITLPPKQFQDHGSPEFDPIRHKPWFQKLHRSATNLWNLKMAHAEMTACVSIGEPNDPIGVIARRWDVDVPTLRQYVAFAGQLSALRTMTPHQRKACQIVIDMAYDAYREHSAAKPFHYYLAETASSLSEDAEAIVTLWETDHAFYPTGYRKPQ